MTRRRTAIRARIARVVLWLVALVALGAQLGALLIPVAFFWLVFGG